MFYESADILNTYIFPVFNANINKKLKILSARNQKMQLLDEVVV